MALRDSTLGGRPYAPAERILGMILRGIRFGSSILVVLLTSILAAAWFASLVAGANPLAEVSAVPPLGQESPVSSSGPPTPGLEAHPELSKKQKRDLLKSNFEKLRDDADELADLAKSLQDDLDKSNENVLSLKVVDKAEKIEKLAKKIKGEARGY